LRNFAENRRRDQAAKMLVTDIVERHQDQQPRIVCRQKSDEGRDQPGLEVTARSGIHHLRGTGLARHGEVRNLRQMAGAVGAVDHVAQEQVHLMGHFGRHGAAQNLRRVPQNFVAVGIVGRLDYVWAHHEATVGDRGIGGRELDRRNRNALSEAVIGKFDLAPFSGPA